MLGELAEKQGRSADAVRHYRKSAQTRPFDVALLYKLAQAVSKEGGADSEAEFQRLMEQILKLRPNNLRSSGAAHWIRPAARIKTACAIPWSV